MNESKEVDTAWDERDVKSLTEYYFNKILTPKQVILVRKITFHKELDIWRMCISAMTRWGKSFCVTIGIGLYLIKETNKTIPFIGPTGDQARILRDYMTELVIDCPILLEDSDIEIKGIERIKKEASKTRMTFSSRNNEYRVFSAEGMADRLMGHGVGSGGGIIVKDEAVLINDDANAKIGRMAGDKPEGVLIIELFNPWNRDNKVHEHITDPNWDYTHIGWEDAIKDGRTTKEFIDEQRRELTSLEFQVLYDSNFPDESEDQLIPYWAVKAAIREIPKLSQTGEMRMGVDVAEMGVDITVKIAGGKYGGLYVVDEIRADHKHEVMETTRIIVKMENERQDSIPFQHLTIDALGMGTGVAGRLEELRREGKIMAKVKRFSSSSTKGFTKKEKERFLNMKAKAYFHLRDLFVLKKIIIPPELAKAFPQLIRQLGQMKWKPGSSNRRIRILDPGEGKDDTAKKKSPDFADALCYFSWDDSQRGNVRMLGKKKGDEEQSRKFRKLNEMEMKG